LTFFGNSHTVEDNKPVSGWKLFHKLLHFVALLLSQGFNQNFSFFGKSCVVLLTKRRHVDGSQQQAATESNQVFLPNIYMAY